ncbi:lysozyme inhibitor LprI family protein [Virgibacillus sp. W0430]|uniref:lysozyme inhibitor LprI family protein n=1 Tax=Virgibacillus sp. W0430 TaxID=3391580 RepID=UPI003F44E2D4
MKSNWTVTIGILLATFSLLTACGNPSEDSFTEQYNQISKANSSPSEAYEPSNKGTPTVTQNSEQIEESKDKDNSKPDETEASSNPSPVTTTEKTSIESNNSNKQESKKEDYLKKLNDLEQTDKNSATAQSTKEMELQEAERYKNWDIALNEIYGVLNEQLTPEHMDTLKDEQRNWVKKRDIRAKEASLKYEGTSAEALEYVATQASITKDRCYELVAKHMK